MHGTEAAAARSLLLPDYEVRGSHLSLLSAPPHVYRAATATTPQQDRGLVMVPSARIKPTLEVAIALAQDLDWPLLVLCSHGITAPTVRAAVKSSGADVHLVAADVMPGGSLRGPHPWQTTLHWASRQRFSVDTNRKRNLALCAAKMTGCSWVMFVDDDVEGLPPAEVIAALRPTASSTHKAVEVIGWPLGDFPDHSVVHHARGQYLDIEQEPFIGGAALLIRLRDVLPSCFPPCYNEDWLFLFDALARREVALGMKIGQLPYDPYLEPTRARWEEFGDVLAEGLFHLLHVREGTDLIELLEIAALPDYWRQVPIERGRLIDKITAELRDRRRETAPGSGRHELEKALHAMAEARSQLSRATPESLADFVIRWRRDQQTWFELYTNLPKRDTLKESLVYLGLHDAWIVTSNG